MSTDVDPSGGACDRANLARASRALGAPTSRPRFDAAVVPDDERVCLAATLGVCLADARRALGLTRPRLAELAGCSSTMLHNLESGARRPRRSLLASLAAVLAPADDGDALTAVLVDAAGASLRPDTPGSLRRRQRAADRARRARCAAEVEALRAQGGPSSMRLPTRRQLERMTPTRMRAAVDRYLGLPDHTPGTHRR